MKLTKDDWPELRDWETYTLELVDVFGGVDGYGREYYSTVKILVKKRRIGKNSILVWRLSDEQDLDGGYRLERDILKEWVKDRKFGEWHRGYVSERMDGKMVYFDGKMYPRSKVPSVQRSLEEFV